MAQPDSYVDKDSDLLSYYRRFAVPKLSIFTVKYSTNCVTLKMKELRPPKRRKFFGSLYDVTAPSAETLNLRYCSLFFHSAIVDKNKQLINLMKGQLHVY
jgi:hypothetical protein